MRSLSNANGDEALRYLFQNKKPTPELILLDINLPTISGIDVLRRIREHQLTQNVPVVMLTTSDEEQDRRQSYDLCANSFVRKPIDFDRFVDLIHQIGNYWLEINEPPPNKA